MSASSHLYCTIVLTSDEVIKFWTGYSWNADLGLAFEYFKKYAKLDAAFLRTRYEGVKVYKAYGTENEREVV